MNKVDKMMKAHAEAKELMKEEDLTYDEAFTITWDALPPDPEPEKRPTRPFHSIDPIVDPHPV
tara:strand:- start:10 stop:198 length:189 start_codon:yes stop_codon:yes gene_type:complete